MVELARSARSTRRITQHALRLVATTLVAVVLSANPALASAPSRTTDPAGTFTGTDTSCGFDVTYTFVGATTSTTFTSGRQIVIAASNAEVSFVGPTGRTAAFRASGPGFIAADGRTFTIVGWTVLFGIASGRGIQAGTGRTVVDTSTLTLVAQTGNFVDVCSQIA